MAFGLLGSSFPTTPTTTGCYVTRASLPNKSLKFSKEYNWKHNSRSIFERGSTITTCEKHDEKKYLMNVTQSHEAEPHSQTILKSIIHALDAFRKFSRFYAFIAMSFGVGWIIGSKPLLWALFGSFFFMSAYSVDLPLLRWKKSTILSVMANVFSMLISFNFGPFFHMKTVLNKAAIFPRSLVFATAVMGIFYAIIMLAKDIPDIEGDKMAGLQTLAVRLGPKKVFWFCVFLLEMAYGVAIMIGVSSPFLWSKIFVVLSHAIMALFVWYRATLVDLSSKDSLQAFYMVIFKLIYTENILILFVR